MELVQGKFFIVDDRYFKTLDDAMEFDAQVMETNKPMEYEWDYIKQFIPKLAHELFENKKKKIKAYIRNTTQEDKDLKCIETKLTMIIEVYKGARIRTATEHFAEVN